MKPAKSVIEIWLMGGPSHLELFDPKPDAPREYNGGLKAIETDAKGVRLHQWLPRLARVAPLFAPIRSMTHPQFGHETAVYLMQTGRTPGGKNVHPAISAVIARHKVERGEYRGDLPPSVILTQAKGRFSETGNLGPKWEPLVTGGDPTAARFVVDGITPAGAVPPALVKRRFDLVAKLDDFPVAIPAFEQAGDEARRIMSGDGARAFDLSRETAETRNAYGRHRAGQSLLAARRLVEYGVPYVTVNLTGWDSHKRHFDTMERRTAQLDEAVAALLADLKRLNLLETTLVWMSGEFGRTPHAEWDAPWNGGRNHYPRCFGAMVAGGGFRGGRALGASDALGEKVADRPVTPQDFLGSICERAGLDPAALVGDQSVNPLKELYA